MKAFVIDIFIEGIVNPLLTVIGTCAPLEASADTRRQLGWREVSKEEEEDTGTILGGLLGTGKNFNLLIN